MRIASAPASASGTSASAQAGATPSAGRNTQNSQNPPAESTPVIPVVKAASEQPLATDKLVVGENFWTVYFIEDQVVLMASSNRMLDTIGAVLRQNPDAKLTIRGYAYASGTQASQRRISEQRARYCAQYLQRNFGINAARLTVEWNGADKPPVLAITTNATTYRAAEMYLTK